MDEVISCPWNIPDRFELCILIHRTMRLCPFQAMVRFTNIHGLQEDLVSKQNCVC